LGHIQNGQPFVASNVEEPFFWLVKKKSRVIRACFEAPIPERIILWLKTDLKNIVFNIFIRTKGFLNKLISKVKK
jgi:hypothetical protein